MWIRGEWVQDGPSGLKYHGISVLLKGLQYPMLNLQNSKPVLVNYYSDRCFCLVSKRSFFYFFLKKTRKLLNMGESPEFQGPQNLDQDLSLELGLEVLPSSWREVRWEYHEMLAHVDHESWKLVAGGVIAALMRVCICPSLCGALCVLSNWILKIQRYCFLYSGILFEGQNSYTLDFSCNSIFTYNDYNSC